MTNKQSQDVRDGSTAIQATGNVSVGIVRTYQELRQLVLDIVQAQLAELKGAALEVARQRAEDITERFLKKLCDTDPELIQKAGDPDFVWALGDVQRQFARSGDPVVGDMLVDLLVQRSASPQRDLTQLVLNEAIAALSKLTNDQIDMLALVFVMTNTVAEEIKDWDSFGRFLDSHVQPLLGSLQTRPATFAHIQYAGCGSMGWSSENLMSTLHGSYRILFAKGFDRDYPQRLGLNVPEDLLMPCLNAPGLYELAMQNEATLNNYAFRLAIEGEDLEPYRRLLIFNPMNEEETRSACITLRPYMAELFAAWDKTQLKALHLTSVGVAIGHARLKQLVGSTLLPLSTWIN